MTSSNNSTSPPLLQTASTTPPFQILSHQNPSISSASSPFHHLLPDCIHVILHYHVFYLENGCEWSYGYVCYIPDDEFGSWYDMKSDGVGNSDCNFLCKFAHCCHFMGDHGLKEFLSSCRDWHVKPSFYYLKLQNPLARHLIESGAVNYLRGVTEFHIEDFVIDDDDLNPLFRNIRGVKKLSIAGDENNDVAIGCNDLQNLRGIQEAYFACCSFFDVEDNAFENLRGIKSLDIQFSTFRPSIQLLKNLRGIQQLALEDCIYFSLVGRDLKDIRGVRSFLYVEEEYEEIPGCSLEVKDFEHFRGIECLRFVTTCNSVSSISGSAFRNLRGVKKLRLSGLDLSHIKSESATANLRGVEAVYMEGFPDLTLAVHKANTGSRCERWSW